ncbi:MAG: TonB-dependent receptor [Gammaproteobacteria bacterium]|nr:TonB-dependent receptor [Gammaproteobacteria bacterium]
MPRYARLLPVVIMGLGVQAAAAEMLAAAEPDLMLLYENEEVVEIATGTAKPIHLAPSVASVITAKEIKAMGWRTLDEALESVPGLHVSRSFNRNNSLYSIRGIHTGQNPQVLLLVNGLQFNDILTGGRPPLFKLPVENIARIEVIRGPGSAVFGADAFAGVINVITKEASDIGGIQVGARAGSFDTKDVWVQDGIKLGLWDVALSMEYSHSDGDRGRIVKSDLQKTFDTLFGTHASLTPGPLETRYELLNTSITVSNDHWNIWFNSWNLGDAGVGPGAAQALDTYGWQDVGQYSGKVDYSGAELAPHWKLDAHMSYRIMDQDENFRLFPPGASLPIGADGNLLTTPVACVVPTNHPVFGPVCMVSFPEGMFGNPGGTEKNTYLEAVVNYDGIDNHLLRMALGYNRSEFEARATQNFGPGIIDGTVSPISGALTDVTGRSAVIFSPDVTRSVHYLSLQDEWRVAPDWELTAGVRHDNYSDFGNTTNPRLALVWATDYNLTTKLLYGRAFRAPSVTDLYFQNNPAISGNRNLEPEIIDMIELAFDYRPSFELQTVWSLYGYDVDRLIEFDSNNVAQNARSQKGRGIEIELTWQATQALTVKGNMAFQHSEDKKTGAIVIDAPRRHANVAAVWKFIPAWIMSGQVNWVADRARATETPARAEIGDYTTVDAALRYAPVNNSWELAAGIRNLFDQDAREPSNGSIPDDYPLEGRGGYLEARYHFE